MDKPIIPHATQVEVIVDPPRSILHVKTELQHHPTTPGYDAERHYEMMQAIGRLTGPGCEYDRYVIHAPDNLVIPRT